MKKFNHREKVKVVDSRWKTFEVVDVKKWCKENNFKQQEFRDRVFFTACCHVIDNYGGTAKKFQNVQQLNMGERFKVVGIGGTWETYSLGAYQDSIGVRLV